ncbi:hypothetical protein DM02DRAFT_537553 [Periconia macrospinosa]|uniref:Uncharacterized protein n=1 Tax=Periconia macrospinosa TaxID=97972 RepID=A0A2V1DB51_9PLEO|nr:hypothetical protein DM02DRAFT_537553 [Periconia macrospinosa]
MLQASNEELEQVLDDMQKLRKQNAELQDKLDHTVAKMMELQGGVDQITDGNVKKQFEALYSSIQDWVTDIELDLMQRSRDCGKHVFRGVISREPNEKLLRRLGFRHKDESIGTGEAVRNPSNEDYMKMIFLGTLDTCVHVIFCRYIWSFLERHIFYRRYPLGLPSDPGKAIWYIHDAIKGGNNDDGDGELAIGSCCRPSVSINRILT